MAEHKWETKREAYCAGYEDGADIGESMGYRSAVPVVFLWFVVGVVVGVVVI